MSFTEQVEALGVDRQKHFQRALLEGKPLRPRKGEWTIGDLIFLAGTINVMMESIPPISEDEFRLPLQEVFGE